MTSRRSGRPLPPQRCRPLPGRPASQRTRLRPTRGPGSCARRPPRSPAPRPPRGSTPAPAAFQSGPGPGPEPTAPQRSCRLWPQPSVPPGDGGHPPCELDARLAAPEGADYLRGGRRGDLSPVSAKPGPSRPRSATGASLPWQLPGRRLPEDRLTPPSFREWRGRAGRRLRLNPSAFIAALKSSTGSG